MIPEINEINTIDIYSSQERVAYLIGQLIFKGYTIAQIEKMCPKLTIYSIIDYLISYYGNNMDILAAINRYYGSLRINENKCLIIADTHIGKLLSNENQNTYMSPPHYYYKNDYALYYAYNYAARKQIKSIIHLGDLIEGNSNDNAIKLPIMNQIDYLNKIYPCFNEIKTYLLYGNHDYNAIRFNGINNKFFQYCNNVELIGVNNSYIYFCNCPIKLSHYCRMAFGNIQNLPLPYAFELAGHSHIFEIKEEKDPATNKEKTIVTAPTLSCLEPSENNIGFLEMENAGNDFAFRFFDQNANIKEEKVLTRKKRLTI